jgi:hypothetical protein
MFPLYELLFPEPFMKEMFDLGWLCSVCGVMFSVWCYVQYMVSPVVVNAVVLCWFLFFDEI